MGSGRAAGRGGPVPGSVIGRKGINGELEQLANRSALEAGLLMRFPEVAKALGVEERTLEHWAVEGHLRVVHLERRRYPVKAQVEEFARCLSPEEAGKLLGLSGRQVRNLIHDGKLAGALCQGRRMFIPMFALRAYANCLRQT